MSLRPSPAREEGVIDKACPLPAFLSPAGLGKRCNRPPAPFPQEGMLTGPEWFELVRRLSRLPASFTWHFQAARLQAGRGAAAARAFLGEALWLPHSPSKGVVPPSPSSSVNPNRETHTVASPNGKKWDLKVEEVRSALEVILEAEGQGQTGPAGHQGSRWHRMASQKDPALRLLAGIAVPPLRPPFQGICGLPWLGRATIATATGFPESLHCSSISGCGEGAAPPGPAPQPHPLMTLSLLY